MYALSCVKHCLPPDIFWTLVAFLQVVGLLWCKVLYADSLPTLRALVAECVCRIEKYLPITERDIKLHLLADMVDSIENWGELRGGFSQLCMLLCSVAPPARMAVRKATHALSMLFDWLAKPLCPLAFLLPCTGPAPFYSMFRPEGKWGEMMRCLLNQNCPESTMLAMMMDKEMVNLFRLVRELQPSIPSVDDTSDDAGDVWGQEAQLVNPVVCVVEKPFLRTRRLDLDQAAALHLYYMRDMPEYKDLWERFVNEAVGCMTPAERASRNIQSNRRGGWKLPAPVLQTFRLQWQSWQPATGPPLTRELPVQWCWAALALVPNALSPSSLTHFAT